VVCHVENKGVSVGLCEREKVRGNKCVCDKERVRKRGEKSACMRVEESVCHVFREVFLCVVDVVNPKADKQMTPSYSEEVKKNLKKGFLRF